MEDLMLAIHPNAHTTPAGRREIAYSPQPTGLLAQRFWVSTVTIRNWRKCGPNTCQDRSSRPHKLSWSATQEERAIIWVLHRATGFPLDDLTFMVTHFLPHLNRDAVYGIVKAEGLGRLPPAHQSKRESGSFKDDDLAFMLMDINHLPKRRTADEVSRKRYLYADIDRCARWIHLAIQEDETPQSAIAFLKEAVAAFPFKITHVLTGRGSCLTADGFEDACRKLKVQHRITKPCTPQTHGLLECFNGRVQREALGITISSHHQLAILLRGFNQVYNMRRQRVLNSASSDQLVRSRLAAEPKLMNPHYKPPDPRALSQAPPVAVAKEISHPDKKGIPYDWSIGKH
jgi:Integrase core domain